MKPFALLAGAGVSITAQAFFTYKQDDKIDMAEGSDTAIAAITQPFISLHGGQGVNLPVQSLFTYKQDDQVDFSLPEGAGGYVQPWALIRLMSDILYINNIGIDEIEGIVVGGTYYSIEQITEISGVELN